MFNLALLGKWLWQSLVWEEGGGVRIRWDSLMVIVSRKELGWARKSFGRGFS